MNSPGHKGLTIHTPAGSVDVNAADRAGLFDACAVVEIDPWGKNNDQLREALHAAARKWEAEKQSRKNELLVLELHLKKARRRLQQHENRPLWLRFFDWITGTR